MLPVSLSVHGIDAEDYQFLMQMKDNNIKWIEVSCCKNHQTIDQSQKLCDVAVKNGLKLGSIHIPFGKDWFLSAPNEQERQEHVKKTIPFIKLAGEYGIRNAVVHPSMEPLPDEQRSAQIISIKKSIHELCDVCEQYAVTLAVENLPRTCLCNTSDETLDIVTSDPRAKICLDFNHILNDSPVEFIKKTGHLIRSLHISDYDGVDERHWIPGEGVLNFKEIINALKQSGYCGIYNLECKKRKDGTDASNPIEIVSAFYKTLE
jgi:sugar phosphate isomerases/epimerases